MTGIRLCMTQSLRKLSRHLPYPVRAIFNASSSVSATTTCRPTPIIGMAAGS